MVLQQQSQIKTKGIPLSLRTRKVEPVFSRLTRNRVSVLLKMLNFPSFVGDFSMVCVVSPNETKIFESGRDAYQISLNVSFI